jgi:RHS repeat-associated protein
MRMNLVKLSLLLLVLSTGIKAQNIATTLPVVWTNLIGCTTNSTSVTSTNVFKWASADSKNKLLPTADGAVQYTLSDLDKEKAFGLNDASNDVAANTNGNGNENINNIDFGFYYQGNNNKLWLIKKGVWTFVNNNTTNGMVLKIERMGATHIVNYYINGSLVGSSNYAVTNQNNLIVSAVLAKKSSNLQNVTCNFNTNNLNAFITKEHTTDDNLYSGIIAVEPTGGIAPYSIVWPTLNNSTEFVQANLYPGSYTAIITDALNATYTIITDIGIKNNWRIQNNIAIAKNVYTQTSPTPNKIGALVSYNILPKTIDGFYELTITDNTNNTAFGFLGFNEADIDLNYSAPYPKEDAVSTLLKHVDSLLLFNKINLIGSVKPAIYNQLHLVYFINGIAKIGFKSYTSTTTTPITYKEGDVFKLQRTGSNINLYKNNVIVATENFTSLASQYLVDGLFVTNGVAKINGLGSIALTPNFLELAKPPIYSCSEPNLNWVHSRSYDENGQLKSESKTYMDMIGRTIQAQSRVLSKNNVMVAEPLYDSFGRAVGQSLPAPSFNPQICYVPKFIELTPNVAYSAKDFDNPVSIGAVADLIDGFNAQGDVNNPKPVSDATKGKLGWYYSDNNTEENLVAADELPYSRVEYYNDGRVRRVASVGTNLKMGSGHETKMIYTSTPPVISLPASNELNFVFPHRTYELEKDFSVNSTSASNVNLNLQLFKTISINPDGKDQITYSNSSGQTIATCITGDGSGCVTHLDSRILYPYTSLQEKIQNLYLPQAKTNTFRFGEYNPQNLNFTPTLALPVLKDIAQSYVLVSGTDYAYNATTGYFTFMGSYANQSLYLQITYANLPTTLAQGNYLTASVEVDYTQWTLYFYDRKGRLLANSSPNEAICQALPYLVQRTNTSGGKPGSCDSPNVGKINMNEQARVTNKSTLFIKIKPKALSINTNLNTAYSPSNFVFKSPAQKYTEDSLSFASKPIIPDSNITVKVLDSTYINAIGLLNQATVDFYRKLDSLETQVPRNALRGKKIAFTGNFAVYAKYLGQPNKVKIATLPYNFDIQADEKSLGDTSKNIACRIGPYNTGFVIIKKDLNPDLKEEGVFSSPPLTIDGALDFIEVRAEDRNTDFSGFGNAEVANTSGCEGNNYIPIDFWPIANALSGAVDLSIGVALFDTPPTPIPVKLANRYMYDEYDRLVGSINEDQGAVDYVYDQTEDKLLFTQNDKQRATGGKFSCIIYDKLGRATITGEYDPLNGGPTSGGTPYEFQNYYDYKNGLAPAANRISTGVPAYANNTEIYNDGHIFERTFVEYDDADAQLPIDIANTAYTQKYTAAKVSKTYNAQSTTWYSYDELGRQTWSVQQSAELGYKTMNYGYDMRGNLLSSVYQLGKPDNMFHAYTYDADERLTTANFGQYTGTPGFMKPLSNYSYYLHGPLKRSVLGGNVQGLDMVYTIDGKLKSVNNPLATATNQDPGLDSYTTGPNASIAPDAFAFSLEYYPNDYKRTNSPIQALNYSLSSNPTQSYTGLIKAVSWQTKLPTAAPNAYGSSALMYEYNYDEQYRLTGAQFGTLQAYTPPTSTGPISPLNATFTQLPEYKLQNISYDKNGNLQTLKRYAAPINPTTAHVLDDLTYNYSATHKNSLLNIKDLASNTAGYTPDVDLPDQPANANYVYNQIGELIANAQEDKGYEYNAQGLTSRVYKLSTGLNIATFVYNDKALRHTKTSYNAAGVAFKETYYSYDAGGAQVATYTKNVLVASAPTQLQDYTLYGAGRVAMLDATTNTAQFELTDHLGNIRAVVSKNTVGQVITQSYTDYYPHGGVLPSRSYSGSLNFPYAYQGQERDAETGLLNFELRQYDPRIGRWNNPDPYGQHHSPYLAMSNNPISSIDPDGGWDSEEARDGYNNGEYNLSGYTSNIYNPDAFSKSEFDNNYNHGGALGGSVNADGSFYSSDSQVSDAHDNYINNNIKTLQDNAARDIALIPSDGHNNPVADGRAVEIIGNYYVSSKEYYSNLKAKGKSQEKSWGSKFDDAIGSAFFGSMENYNAMKKNAGDDNPYMMTRAEMNDAVMVEAEILSMFVPVGEVFQGLKWAGRGLAYGGKTFNEFKAAYWATRTKPVLSPIVNTATGKTYKVYMELHHRFISQRLQRSLNLPNWLVNNRINLQALNGIEHAMKDPYRWQFLPKWVKEGITNGTIRY